MTNFLNNLRINADRLNSWIQELGKVGALPGGGVCRLAFSKEDKQGRDLVMGWMQELGLQIHSDAIGNVIGIRKGSEDGPPVMMGSHIDTVRTGGLYDGNLGVLAGLEVIASLNDAQIETPSPIAVGFFSNEEGARFAPDMMGSFVYVGDMSVEDAKAVVGIDGITVDQAMRENGILDNVPTAPVPKEIKAFIELHIEQGPVLDREDISIGVVEQVQGISWTEFTFTGTSNHAGTTPMSMREDAGYVAAETAVFARKLAWELGGNQVATVGHWDVAPNLVNVVPNQVTLTVDLRNTDENILQQAEQRLHAAVSEIAAKENVRVSHRELARFEPVPFAPEVVDRVKATAEKLGYSVKRMPSGAGHDAQMLARICPAGMIFVPSAGGISHNITEHTALEDLTAGADVLLHTVLDLATATSL